MKQEKAVPVFWPMGMRVQASLVILLFLGSLAVMLLNAFKRILCYQGRNFERATQFARRAVEWPTWRILLSCPHPTARLTTSRS